MRIKVDDSLSTRKRSADGKRVYCDTRPWNLLRGNRTTQRWRQVLNRFRRTASAARLTSRAATRWVVHRLHQGISDAAERERLRLAYHLRTAEDVTATMGAMKGAMMKLAQMLSYVDAGIPEAYRETLSRLQANAPPMT